MCDNEIELCVQYIFQVQKLAQMGDLCGCPTREIIYLTFVNFSSQHYNELSYQCGLPFGVTRFYSILLSE